MALDYQQLKSAQLPTVREAYGPERCILYALGVGAGLSDAAPLNGEVALLYEDRLEVLSAMASVIGYPGFWMRDAKYGLDWARVVHGEQRLKLYQPLAVAAEVTGCTSVRSISDKGADKGAVVVIGREIRDAHGALLAQVEQVNFCRGDGAYSKGDPEMSDAMPAPIGKPPTRAPDAQVQLPTSRNQAAIYRLCGDRNPLHIDPAAAQLAGFPSPIMHGAATMGMVNRALRCVDAGGNPTFLSDLQVRFTGAFYPGDTMSVQVWRSGHEASFRCSAVRGSSEVAYGTALWTPLS